MHDLLEKLCIRVPKVFDWVNREVRIARTFRDLEEIGFNCDPDRENANANDDPCQELGKIVEVNCFLTDEEGNRVDTHAIQVFEGGHKHGRKKVTATLPNGDEVTLRKVTAVVQGFFVVEVVDAQGEFCVSEPQPFVAAETFFLCAPEGTKLNGHVIFFDCEAHLICMDEERGRGTRGGDRDNERQEFHQLDVTITLCLDVQMEADVKIELEAKFCKPRQELPIDTCSVRTIPPQCPEIFPVSGKKRNC